MTIKETVRLRANEFRKLCIREEWYTKGTNEEYNNLFKMFGGFADKEVNTNDLYAIAKDIFDHSDFDDCDVWSENEAVSSIMFFISRVCNRTYSISD